MGILQALFGSQIGQQGMQNGFTPVQQMPQNQVQQAPQTLGLVQDILSQRFQPQLQDIGEAASRTGTTGSYVSPEQVITSRLSPVMDIAKTLGTLNQSQLEIAKLNEMMRHDVATEGQSPVNQPLTVGPTVGGGVTAVPPTNIPTLIQNNAPKTAPLNNPGNLRPVGSTTGFQQFATPQAGADAMTQDLTAKITGNSPAMAAKFGPNYQPTLRNLITTYAPPTENNTENYIASISRQTGIAPDQVLSTADIAKLQPAMVNIEQGTTVRQGPVENAAYTSSEQPSPAGQPFMPIFKGNEILKGNLSPNFDYVANPAGGIKAQQVPGTIEKGANGEILNLDPQTGKVTQQIPTNPQAQAKFESNLQKIASLFDELHKQGASVEAGGSTIRNKINQLESTKGITWGDTQLLPGGQTVMEGSKAQQIRGEIQDLIQQTTPLYMQAMGITPGMERAASAQEMLQKALGGVVGKSRQENQYSIANLSKQAGTGDYSQKYEALRSAQDAISKGAPADAVKQRLKAYGIDPGELE